MLDYRTSTSRSDPAPIQRQSIQPDFSLRTPRRRGVGERETSIAGPGLAQSLRGCLDHASPSPASRPPLVGVRLEGPALTEQTDIPSGDGAGVTLHPSPTKDHTFIHR